MTDLKEQLIALGAVFESAALVDKLARTGLVATPLLECQLHSLLVRNPKTTLEIYGGDTFHLHEGFKTLSGALERNARDLPRDPLRYALAMISLEKQLYRRGDMLNTIADCLDQIEKQVAHFGLTHPNVIASFAALYQDTISTFRQRIQVHGDMRFLQNPDVAAKVRALLLAGIRSARLWHQLGGSRWQMIVNRRKLLDALPNLIRNPS